MYFPETLYQTTTIASGAGGAGLSAALTNAIAGYTIVGFDIDGIDSTTTITFQILCADGTYRDLYDESGEYQVTGVVGGKYRKLDPVMFLAALNIKVRTGVTGTAVNQAALRTLHIYYRAVI